MFAGLDVCAQAGFTLPDGSPRVVFEDDVWDFTHVVGLPHQMPNGRRRFDFTAIANPTWRLVAKEQIVAMLAPRHEAVAFLPRAYRTPLHLATASGRLAELTRLFTWLTAQGVTGLGQVDTDQCEAYLAHRRYLRDEHGVVVGERSPATRRAAAQAVVDLVNHRDLFSTDRVRAEPAALGWCHRLGDRADAQRTDPEQDPTGPRHRPATDAGRRQLPGRHPRPARGRVVRARSATPTGSGRRSPVTTSSQHAPPTAEFAPTLLDRYERDGQPLPVLADHHVRDRLAAGWSAHDPLTPIALGLLARQAGFTQFWPDWIPPLREPIEATLRIVGAAKPFARNAIHVLRPDGAGELAWTLPLDRGQAVALVGIVRTAAITTLAAVSGMRASELMELRVGATLPPEHYGPELVRYRLASRIVKGQAAGRGRRRMGRHRTRLPGRRTPATPPPRTRGRGAPARAGSPSTSATSGSAPGSTAPPGNAWAWPSSRRSR